MSRHSVVVRGEQHGSCPEACVGYDAMLRTYFLQAFLDGDGICAIWLGCLLEEYLTLDALLRAAMVRGLRVEGITSAARDGMEQEAKAPKVPGVMEWLGLVR